MTTAVSKLKPSFRFHQFVCISSEETLLAKL